MKRIRFVLPLMAALALAGCESKMLVGVVLPETGEVSAYGTSIKAAVKLAFDDAIAAKKLPPNLVVVYKDSGSNPTRAADEAEALYRDGALLVLGGATSPEAKAMLRVAERHGRVLLSPSASLPELAKIGGWFFRVYPSDDLEGATAASFMATAWKARSVLVVQEDVPYTEGLLPVFTADLGKLGGHVVMTVKTSDPSWRKQLQAALAKLRPQAVYLCGYAEGIVSALKEIRGSGYAGGVCTTSAICSAEVLGQAGPVVDGVFFPRVSVDLGSTEEPIRSFATRYRELTGHGADVYAAHGYDAALVAIHAFEDPSVRSAALMRARIRALADKRGVTGPLDFDDLGNVSRRLQIHQILGGKPVVWQAPAAS